MAQNQVINTVEKGLNTDMNPQYQPKGSYRDIRNMRLVNNGGDNYTLQSDEGMSLAVTIPQPLAAGKFWEIIGWESYEDLEVLDNKLKVIVFLTATDGSGWGQIGEYFIDPTTGVGTYSALYTHSDLDFDQVYSMNDVMIKNLYETENIIRSYWTNNKSEPKVLNIALLGTIADGDLVVGKQYMVASGSVTHNGTPYSPFTNNIFTAVNVNYTGTGIVKEYIPIEQLDWVVARSTASIINLAPLPDVGNIQVGLYTIAVRLRYKNEYRSPWTPVNNFQHIAKESITTSNYQEIQGDVASVYTAKTLQWIVRVQDSHYDTMEVAMIRATDEGVFDSPVIIYSGPYLGNGSTNVVSYDGTQIEETITAEELAELLEVFSRVGTIETTKNKMFAGDVEFYDDLPEIDFSSINYRDAFYEMPHDNYEFPTNAPIIGHNVIPSSIASGGIVADGLYQVSGTGEVNYPQASSYVYKPGDIFRGVHNSKTYLVNGSPTVRAVTQTIKLVGSLITSGNLIIGKRYIVKGSDIGHGTAFYKPENVFVATQTTYTGGSAYQVVDEVTSLANDFWDHKGVVNSAQKKSYMRKEIYRFGLMPYDTKGNPMGARHLVDFTFSDIENAPVLADYFTDITNNEFSLRSLGLEIGSNVGAGDGIDLTSWINPTGSGLIEDSLISGFSIVRAKRIERTIAKGLVYSIGKDSAAPNHYFPEAHILEAYDKHQTTSKYYTFLSSDLLLDSSIDLIDEDLELSIEIGYDVPIKGTNPKGILEATGANDNDAFYHKYTSLITSMSPVSIGDTANVEQITKVFQGETGIEIDTQDNTAIFDNITETDGTAWPAATPTSTAAQTGIGGTKHVLKLSNMTNGTFKANANPGDSERVYAALRRKSVGGYSTNENTDYYSVGHYQEITQSLINEIGTVFAGIKIFGGDTYLGMFDYATVVSDESTTTANNYSFGIAFPTESRMNFNFRRGRHFARDGFKIDALNPNGISEISVENLILDGQYKNNEYLIGYPGFSNTASVSNKSPRTVNYSDTKTNGEIIDNWRQFRVNNAQELDSNGGRVMALKAKQNYLFAFQRHMVTYLPVNQQAAVSEAFNQLFTIGVGGVIDRYDNIDSFLGLEDKGSLIETPDGLMYFNRENQAIVYMKTGGKGAEISSIKFIKNLIDETIFKGRLARNTNRETSDNEIVAGYDAADNEVFMTFKAVGIYNYTVTMDDTLKQFTGIYDFIPFGYLKYRDLTISVPDIRKYGAPSAVSYPFGATIRNTEATELYVAILPGINAWGGAEPSTDPSFWKKFYTSGEIYIHNFAKDKAAFYYGRSYEEYVELIVNDQNNSQKMFDAYSINGEVHNGEDTIANAVVDGTGMIDIIDTKTTYQDRSEIPQDLKWRNNNFIGTYQTDRTDTVSKRLRDKYLSVTLRKTNWIGDDPTTNTGILRKIVSLVTKLRNSF